MHCPFCRTPDTKVIDSRLSNETNQVRRRRECVNCGERFTTFEAIELNLPKLIKQNGNRESFDVDKMRSGMQRALEKRPVAAADFESAVSRIKHQAMVCGEREIHVSRVGEWVMKELAALDQVAYVRFASVYRSFEHVSDFSDEIEKLAADRSNEEELPPLDPASMRSDD